jgi:methionyl-tRNA synthetase
MQTRLGLNLASLYAVLASPFIPDAPARILEHLRRETAIWPEDLPQFLSGLAPGHAFEVPPVLFAKITDDQRDAWQASFSGK